MPKQGGGTERKMMKCGKIFAVILAVCLLANGISTAIVSAEGTAWYHLSEKITFDGINDDISVISVDFEKKQDLCYMFTLSSPQNTDDPYSTSTWTNVLSVMLATDGSVRCFGNGGWLSVETDGANIGEVKADGLMHNLKISHDASEKKIRLYLDDIYSYTVDYSERISVALPPCNMIVVSGDLNNRNDSGIEYSLVSAMGLDVGELGTEILTYDTETKNIKVNFSEAVVDKIDKAVLKPANIAKGERKYTLEQKAKKGSEITFEYDADFESLEEYIIVLPEGLRGKFGSVLKNNTLSFVAPNNKRVIKNSDYTTFDVNADVKIGNGTTWTDRSLHKADYPGAYEVFSWQGSYDGGREYKWNTYNWGMTDNRIIPTGSGVSEISFDVIPKRADMQMGFDLRHNADASSNASKGYEIVMDENGNILGAPGAMTRGWSTKNSGWDSYVIGKYEKDKPFNIKYVIDKPNKTLKIYIDNVLKRTVTETTDDKTSVLNTTTESYLNIYEMFGADGSCIYGDRETLFLLDNVKLEIVPNIPYSYIANSDYTTFDVNTDVKIEIGTKWTDRSLHKADYPGAYEVFSWQGSYDGGREYKWNTYNWATADNRIIPTGSGVSEISFDVIPKRADMQMGFDLRHNADASSNASKGYEIVMDENGNILGAPGAMTRGWSTKNSGWDGYIIGKYEKDKPFNIKYVIDKPNKTLKIYIDNVLKKTVIETTDDKTSVLNTTTESYLNIYEMFGSDNSCIYGDRETLFLLDNVKLKSDAAAVSWVRFNTEDGENICPSGKSDSMVNSIDVYMNYAVDKTVLDANTKLFYGDDKVEFTSAYNAAENCYTIIPNTKMTSNNVLKLCIEGESVNGVMMPKAYVTYANISPYVSGAKVSVTDESGVKAESLINGRYYIDASVSNYSPDDQKVNLIVAEYSGVGLLKNIEVYPITVESGNEWKTDKDSDEKIEIDVDEDVSAIKAYIWSDDSNMPCCHNETVFKAQ